jgi:hypothetical protein
VLEVLWKNQIPAYDIDENVRRERLPIVIEAYAQQFRKDFKNFLKLRATELVEGGHMVLSLIGRRPNDSTSEFSDLWEIIAKILRAMASEVHLFIIIFYHIILSFGNNYLDSYIVFGNLPLCCIDRV